MHCDDAAFEGVVEKFRVTLPEINNYIIDLEIKRDGINNQFKLLPTLKGIEDKREMLLKELTKRADESYTRSGLAFEALPFDEQKKIINEVFGGQDDNGKKYGVYVKPSEGKRRRCQFKAYGRIGDIYGLVKMYDGGHDSFAIPSKTRYASPGYGCLINNI